MKLPSFLKKPMDIEKTRYLFNSFNMRDTIVSDLFSFVNLMIFLEIKSNRRFYTSQAVDITEGDTNYFEPSLAIMVDKNYATGNIRHRNPCIVKWDSIHADWENIFYVDFKIIDFSNDKTNIIRIRFQSKDVIKQYKYFFGLYERTVIDYKAIKRACTRQQENIRKEIRASLDQCIKLLKE